jgi:hypothetical protein
MGAWLLSCGSHDLPMWGSDSWDGGVTFAHSALAGSGGSELLAVHVGMWLRPICWYTCPQFSPCCRFIQQYKQAVQAAVYILYA